MSEYSKALQRETRELQNRLGSYEQELRKAESLRESTFEEMREIRSEVAQIFESLQDKNGRREGRKLRHSSRSNLNHSERDKAASLRETSKVPKWLTHVSVLLALFMMWSFFVRGQFEKSVERKLLLCLCCPMLWMYIQVFRLDTDDTKTHFIVASMAFFMIGFTTNSFFHPNS